MPIDWCIMVYTKKQKDAVQTDGYIGKNPNDGMIEAAWELNSA